MGFRRLLATYTRMLKWVLSHQLVTLIVTILVAFLSVFLYFKVPKGFFPQQDTGRIQGSVIGAQDISFQSMADKMRRYVSIVMADPAVDTMAGFTGGNTRAEPGPLLRDAEAAGGARSVPEATFLAVLPVRDRRRRDQPSARQAGGRAGRDADSAVGTGTHDWRTVWQCAVSVHAAEREPGRSEHVGAALARRS